jgi:predicted enzyme related to lactoylglutathione lyase
MENRKINYIDITANGATQTEFYKEVFGWETQTIKMPNGEYTVW